MSSATVEVCANEADNAKAISNWGSFEARSSVLTALDLLLLLAMLLFLIVVLLVTG